MSYGADGGERPSMRRLVARFARIDMKAALHLLARWAGFPAIATLARAAPLSGTILDFGCGHGHLAQLLAEGSPYRRVVGLDRIVPRLDVARKVAAAGPAAARTAFICGDGLGAVRGPFDAIVIADVLFYQSAERQRATLAQCARLLAPGGVLILGEQVDRPRWKSCLVKLQEWLVVFVKVRIARSTVWRDVAPSGTHLWHRAELERFLEELGLRTISVRLDRFSYLSHTLFIARKSRASPYDKRRREHQREAAGIDSASDRAITLSAASR